MNLKPMVFRSDHNVYFSDREIIDGHRAAEIIG